METLSIREFHTYQVLADQGIVPHFKCPVNEIHTDLLPDIDDSGNLYLYCLACNSKLRLGANSVKMIRRYIQQALQSRQHLDNQMAML